ncbi:PBSX family phage terminase large subunit [Lapidilactobacillus bayanensis]|uniref:PBSX family phage terminase large subunit n=1 Tax=Lapidilactobacillus bayanensis TaxID=2485998 RepID=UPI0021F06E6F|nr:PBSX family phage terminase large subunit [Lapidilactobacillus bayanensis]
MVKVSIAKALGKGYNRYYHNRNFYRVVKGSRGSKKSKDTALCYIHDILKYTWANLLVIRRYSNTNKQSTYSDLKWAANQLRVAHLFKFNESMPEITVIATGQKILFRGLDDELKITSVSVDVGNLCWLWCEEAYQIENQDKFDTVVESIRGSNPDPEFYKQITLTFNPWSERHWLKRAFFDEETRYRDVFAITTTFRVNEWLDEQDRKRYLDLYRTNPRRARIVADGEWGVAEGLVFDNFDVVDFDPISKIKQIGVTAYGMDFGFSHDPTTLPELIYDAENKELWVYGELYKHGALIDDLVSEIKKRDLMTATIRADAASPQMIAELKAKGVRRVVPSNKGKDSIDTGITFLQGLKIHIHPSCEHTIEEFNTYVYDQDKEGNWLNKPVDKNNHIIDAIRYAVEPFHGKPKVKAHLYKNSLF